MTEVLINDASIRVVTTVAAQKLYDFDFLAYTASSVFAVFKTVAGVETALTSGVHFTVAGLGVKTGGTIDITASGIVSAVGDSILIYRSVPIERTADYAIELRAAVFNRELDIGVMIDQELRRDVDRAAKVALGGVGIVITPGAAGEVLEFDAAGNLKPTTGLSGSVADAEAAAAAAAADAGTASGQAAIATTKAAEASQSAAEAVAATESKADKATTVSGTGLVAVNGGGGGTLGGALTIAVTDATLAEAQAGVVANRAMSPLRTKSAIDAQVPIIVPTVNDDLGEPLVYKARKNRDRWKDSYRLADELQFTGGGAIATDAAVLKALWDRAKAAGRGEIILPRGTIALEALCHLTNPNGTRPLRLVGQGPEQTQFVNTSASQTMFYLGDDGEAISMRMILEGFSCAAAVAPDDAGSQIYVRNMSGLQLKSIEFQGARNAVSLGVGFTAADNNVVYTFMTDCGGTSGSALGGVAFIALGSGAVLDIKGNRRWNANGGHDFIRHANASRNWDGLYVNDQVFENFSKYVYSSGKGIVNLTWKGGQIDRHTIGFHAETTVAAGSNRNWTIDCVQFLGGPTTAGIGVFTSKGSGIGATAIEDIRVTNNFFHDHTGQAVWAADAGVVFDGNTMDNCGRAGATPLIRIGQPLASGIALVQGNMGYRGSGSGGTAYQWGIEWIGAASARRFENNNNFLDWTGGAQTGTR